MMSRLSATNYQKVKKREYRATQQSRVTIPNKKRTIDEIKSNF